MVIDTSALLAVFLGEPERQRFLESITQGETRWISAANVLETGIVLEARRGVWSRVEENRGVEGRALRLSICSIDAKQQVARTCRLSPRLLPVFRSNRRGVTKQLRATLN